MNTYFTQDNIMQRFFFVVGKTKDTFVDEALNAIDVETDLHRHLQELGYERIMFYSKTQKIFCYDETSYKLVVNPNLNIKEQKTGAGVVKGPLGGGMLSALAQQPAPASDELHRVF